MVEAVPWIEHKESTGPLFSNCSHRHYGRNELALIRQPESTPLAAAAKTDEKAPRFRRSTAVKRPLMPRSHIENFLGARKVRLKEKLPNNTAICRFLLERSLQDLGGKPILGPSAEGDDRIARTMASEVIAAINREGHADAQHWYSDSLRKAVRIAALIHPELTDDAAAVKAEKSGFRSSADARTVFFAALAITSQNMRIPDNLRAAREQYASFVRRGRFEPKGYGTKGASIRANLEKFNVLVDTFGGNIAQVDRFMNTGFTMAEITKAAAKVGIKVTGGEMVDEPVFGSILLGPKLGSFWNNLSGNFSTLTIDLWATRTWGRYTGTLIRDSASPEQITRLARSLQADRMIVRALQRAEDWIEPDEFADLDNDELLDYARKVQKLWEGIRTALLKQGADNPEISRRKAELDWPNAAESIVKTLGHPVDAPGTRGKRRWIRNVTNRAIEILRIHGVHLEMAELQALLWIPEKALYRTLSGRRTTKNVVSYDAAMAEVAAKEGVPDERIRAEIRAVEQDRARGRRNSAATAERDPFAVLGNGEGPGGNRSKALSPEERRAFVTGLARRAALRMKPRNTTPATPAPATEEDAAPELPAPSGLSM